jgi:hypothetical protein
MVDSVHKKFDKFICSTVRRYKPSKHNELVIEIKDYISLLYENQETFKYIFERYYSDNRNPFTTAYHQFMNYTTSGTEVENAIYFIAEGILERTIKETVSGYAYITF